MLDRALDRLRFDEWIGTLDGRPTLWAKRLGQRFGWRVSLHRMVGTDDPGCFHTHPAFAVRIVLAGGYVEQLEDGREVVWTPGRAGLVAPALSHRVARLLNGRVSYSLWIRGPKRAAIQLRGDGWPKKTEAADV